MSERAFAILGIAQKLCRRRPFEVFAVDKNDVSWVKDAMHDELRPLRRRVELLNDSASEIRSRLLNCIDAAARRPADALALARSIGETLAKLSLYAIGIKPPAMLDACIQELEKKDVMSRGLVPAEIITMLHKIRTIGNKAAHDALHVTVTSQDVVSVLGDVLWVTRWYFGEFRRGPLINPVFRSTPAKQGEEAPACVVMIGSACRDLPRHQEEIFAVCEELNCQPRVAEPKTSADPSRLEASLELVEEADIYIAVFGFRYGPVPKGEMRSIAHIEYERACERGIPVFVFLMNINHRVQQSDIEAGEGAERLRALKSRIGAISKHKTEQFRSPKELRSKFRFRLRDHFRQVERGESPEATLGPSPPAAQVAASTSAPATDSEGPRRSRQQLLRIETQGRKNNAGQQLLVNLGFSRIWIRDAEGRRLPLVCGCTTARSEIRFQGGRSNADPLCETLAPKTRLVVEFGVGPRPIVRLETCPPSPFMEGRTQLVFEVKEDTVPSGHDLPRSSCKGTITVEPEWFGVERLSTAPGAPAVTEEVEALLNAWLDKLQRLNPTVEEFAL